MRVLCRAAQFRILQARAAMLAGALAKGWGKVKFKLLSVAVAAALLGGCAMTKPQAAADLNAAYNVAAAGAAAYAAKPNANAKTVAQMNQLLSAAQAALVTWTNSQATGDEAALNAAIAALVAYEAQAKVSMLDPPDCTDPVICGPGGIHRGLSLAG